MVNPGLQAENQQLKFNSSNTENYYDPFSLDALADAVSKSHDTAAGLDDSHYRMCCNRNASLVYISFETFCPGPMYHHIVFYADRCHRRRDICNHTENRNQYSTTLPYWRMMSNKWRTKFISRLFHFVHIPRFNHFCRAMLCIARLLPACGVRLSVRLTRSWVAPKRIRYLRIFSTMW